MAVITETTYICDCCGAKARENPVEDWMKRDTKRAKREQRRREETRFKYYVPFYGVMDRMFMHAYESHCSVLLCPRCYELVKKLEERVRKSFFNGYKRLAKEVRVGG